MPGVPGGAVDSAPAPRAAASARGGGAAAAPEETARQYELRTTAQLAEIVRALHGRSGTLIRLPPVKTSAAMLRAIRAAELEPGRGRAKDLLRLHEPVAELTGLLTPGA